MRTKLYDNVIKRIKSVSLQRLQKDDHVILYGSRARGDAKESSDWDLLVLLNKPKIEQSDYNGIVYDLTSLGWDLGEMIIPVIYTEGEWKQNYFTPFYKNVESEGIKIV